MRPFSLPLALRLLEEKDQLCVLSQCSPTVALLPAYQIKRQIWSDLTQGYVLLIFYAVGLSVPASPQQRTIVADGSQAFQAIYATPNHNV